MQSRSHGAPKATRKGERNRGRRAQAIAQRGLGKVPLCTLASLTLLD